MKTDSRGSGERFADIQLLRYRLKGFDELSLKQKSYIYYLSEAALSGRDITTDQFGRYNLRIRQTLEALYEGYTGNRNDEQFQAVVLYLKRLWFSNGIYHHYGCDKFVPEFSEHFLKDALKKVDSSTLPLKTGESVDDLCSELFPVIFEPSLLPKRVNKSDGDDLVLTSACNYYEGVTQQEVEDFYAAKKAENDRLSFGLNSKLVKEDGALKEMVWTTDGLYGPALRRVVECLEKARNFTENERQKNIIDLLIRYYRTGDLQTFDDFSIEWLKETDGQVDFINGFIEVYGDPLGLKASWEALVEYKDMEATHRTQLISQNAQWFEDRSPVDARFRKKTVTGVTANAVCAAMLGGDEYPSTAIGINLPNADWIRAAYGSKSVTISNITEAYHECAAKSGMREEFIADEAVLQMMERYESVCDELHTNLHECLGHGSGQLLPGVSTDALKAYGSTIEEARADLFALYFMADPKMVELGLLPDSEAHCSEYYNYMLNGLMTQLVRIKPGQRIEEDHMRNRALIARWVYDHADGKVSMTQINGKTYLEISDYDALRGLFAELLAEIQRIKSEGDYAAARNLVERYAVGVDEALHAEILERYETLNISPYKGFLNPWLKPVFDKNGNIVDIVVDESETFAEQMLRYSREYGYLSKSEVKPW
ncbi:MAG: dihydrofolate reductase [Prevotella sp.]|nr:dihydrofolate reductase [Prevotella sp.]